MQALRLGSPDACRAKRRGRSQKQAATRCRTLAFPSLEQGFRNKNQDLPHPKHNRLAARFGGAAPYREPLILIEKHDEPRAIDLILTLTRQLTRNEHTPVFQWTVADGLRRKRRRHGRR